MSTRFQNRYAAGGMFAIVGAIFFLFALAAQWQATSQADHLTDIRARGQDISVSVTKVHFDPNSQTATMTADIAPAVGQAPTKLPSSVTVGPEYGRNLLRLVAGNMWDGSPVTIKLRYLGSDYLPVDDPTAWVAPKADTTGFLVLGGFMIAIGVLVFLFYDRIVRKPAV